MSLLVSCLILNLKVAASRDGIMGTKIETLVLGNIANKVEGIDSLESVSVKVKRTD